MLFSNRAKLKLSVSSIRKLFYNIGNTRKCLFFTNRYKDSHLFYLTFELDDPVLGP